MSDPGHQIEHVTLRRDLDLHRHCPACGAPLVLLDVIPEPQVLQFACNNSCLEEYYWDARTMEGRRAGLRAGRFQQGIH